MLLSQPTNVVNTDSGPVLTHYNTFINLYANSILTVDMSFIIQFNIRLVICIPACDILYPLV